MKRRRAIILSIISLVLVAVFGWKGYGWWLEHKLARYKAELVASGEKLTVSELLADRPPLEVNGADLFNEAQAHIRYGPVMTTNQPPAMRLVLPGKAAVSWRSRVLVTSSWGGATNTWSELADELSESERGIQLLHGLINHPDMDFRVDYSQGFNAPIPGLARVKYAAQVLSASAMVDLHQGHFDPAITNICATLALSEGMANERLLICQLVRIAVTHIAINTTWEALQFTNANDRGLRLLQDSLSRQRFISPMRQSFEMERVMSATTIRHYREHGGIYSIYSSPATATPPGTAAEEFMAKAKRLASPREIQKSSTELLWQSALSYEDELRATKGVQVLISACRDAEKGSSYLTVLSNATVQLDAFALPARNSSDGLNYGDELSLEAIREIFGGSPQSLVKSINKVQQADTVCSLAITAVALERYRLQKGVYPSALSALVPEFLDAVPIDPIDRHPLHYQLKPEGTFLLYSIGEDGVDDGGDASNPNKNSGSVQMVRGRDWVWPRPATPLEIKAWEAERSKR